MSEIINNRQHRQKILKQLIIELHNGASIDDVKSRFEELIDGISPMEISAMEQSLIMDGMPVEEVQRLCDVHASVFKGSIEEIHSLKKPEEVSGHPIHTMRLENNEIEKLLESRIQQHVNLLKTDRKNGKIRQQLIDDFNDLWEIDRHYSRKENLIFPFMEKYDITAPPKVMWGVDDEIRADIKIVRQELNKDISNPDLISKIDEVVNKIQEMIFKEENILFPMVLETLSEDEWFQIQEESDEIGYCLIKPQPKWKPTREDIEEKNAQKGEVPSNDGYVKFDAGILLPREINAIFNTLPIDITFVDREGAVKYFSQGEERIFPRPKTIIGRKVQNCHPPASVHIVEKIVEDLKSGKKDHEDFWIQMKDQFVYIRYFAVRDENNQFLGTLEVTQNIKPIQEIKGEKRLLEEE